MTADEPLFELGLVVSTPGVLELVPQGTLFDFLKRHVCGDWGDVPKEDATANKAALNDGSRVMSVYTLPKGERVWVITEAVGPNGRRASTCVLLPSEY